MITGISRSKFNYSSQLAQRSSPPRYHHHHQLGRREHSAPERVCNYNVKKLSKPGWVQILDILDDYDVNMIQSRCKMTVLGQINFTSDNGQPAPNAKRKL
jgi:hypothetical protein